MKKTRFLKELIEKNSLKISRPNKQISNTYGKKSENSLKASKILLENNLIEESVTMSYYSMYHKATCLLRYCGIKCENHKATIILLTDLFKIETKLLQHAKDKRILNQYKTDFSSEKHDAVKLIKQTEEFIAKIDFYIDLLTSEDLKDLIEILKEKVF